MANKMARDYTKDKGKTSYILSEDFFVTMIDFNLLLANASLLN